MGQFHNIKRKKIFDIERFLLTGYLLDIKVGMSRYEIIESIGKPEWYGLGNDISYMTSDMWTYGNIEFYFNYDVPGKDKLGMIFTDNLHNLYLGKNFKINPFIFKQEEDSEIDLEYFISVFKNEYKIKNPFEDQKLLLTKSGVTVAFNKDDSKDDNRFYAFALYSHFNDFIE